MAASLRLADLLASLSMVSDLGFALPPETAMRRCVIATSLARRLELPVDQARDVFHTALLEHIGCTGFAHETAAAFGDEMVINATLATAAPIDLAGTLAFPGRGDARSTHRQPPADALHAHAWKPLATPVRDSDVRGRS